MPNHRGWLDAEQNGQDDLAEQAFGRVIAAMPGIEPGADFVGRTVEAGWRARARRRVRVRLLWMAAALAMGAAGLGSIYELSGSADGLLAHTVVILSRGLVWLLTSVSEGARWWWIPDRIGTAVNDAVAAPLTAAALAAVEMIALCALLAFRRLVRGVGTQESRKVQV